MFAHTPAEDTDIPAGHFVQFYKEERALLVEVSRYFDTALRTGHTGIVIARPDLIGALKIELHRAHIDGLPFGPSRGELVTLDAQQTLDQFMVEGWPDDKLFAQVIGSLVKKSTRGGRKVAAYGEMVALLCEQGRHDAAIHLEKLWNQLMERHTFSLFCAYPTRLFSDLDGMTSFKSVCQAHSRVILPA
ncbi:MAG: MEDS domain-containing protein [Burkholderiales bacterium]|nr:MEDS domain-containing protein [Burkholderiales bacterium]